MEKTIAIHRYLVRPLDEVPQCFPDGSKRIPLDEERQIYLERNSSQRNSMYEETIDEDVFNVIQVGQKGSYPSSHFYYNFYKWLNKSAELESMADVNLIKTYNAILDNLTWLIRDKSYEEELTYSFEEEKSDEPRVSLYEVNQQIYAQREPLDEDGIEKAINDMIEYISSCGKYFMLLCRELYDYTTFIKLQSKSYMHAANEVLDVLEDRGTILDIHWNKEGGYIECWIKYKVDNAPHMYLFFTAESYVIQF